MSTGSPSVFSIDAGQSFVDLLARGILERYGSDPLKLASATILLPNRRAVRSLRDAFLRENAGKPLLLPAIRAIGDVDDGEIETLGAGSGLDFSETRPAIPAVQRQILLCQLVSNWKLPIGGQEQLAPAQAWRLASDLAVFIDQVHTAGASFDDLANLAPENLAAHWSDTLDFLKIVTEHWPKILESLNFQDPAEFRNQTLLNLANFYRERQPSHPVIAAGSTGTIPATAMLLREVALLPEGSVVLPGLDHDLNDATWDSLDELHPQNALKRLLNTMGVSRFEVERWGRGETQQQPQVERQRLIQAALLPSKESRRWRQLKRDLGFGSGAFAGMRAIVAPTRREEAAAIAIALREVLETQGKTAALVTPDRQIALHVRAALRRWNIEIDDSGGDRALSSLPGRLLGLIADAASDRFGPLTVLALLQHPLVSIGMQRRDYLRIVRRLDGDAMRGVRPANGLSGLLDRVRALADSKTSSLEDQHLDVMQAFEAALKPLEHQLSKMTDLASVVTAHIEAAERLCSEPNICGREKLWRGEAGAALSNHLTEILGHAEGLSVPSAESYAAYFAEVISSVTVRPTWNKHPRLAIWGPLEARLQQADLMILGGLNEGVWPAEVKLDPWMSRPMRAEFGLPPVERRTGQSAHDFVMAASAPEVLITRSEKTDGTPTVPSRWWFRIEALAGVKIPDAHHYLDWALQLDMPQTSEPVKPPEPRPPVAARPKQLSVTQIQEWMRDPYAVFAMKILGLSKLDPIDDKPNAAQKGTLLHEALERFLKEPGERAGKAGLDRLIHIGRQTFEPVITQPAVYAFWWPRFERIASWFIEQEPEYSEEFETVLVEGWARKEVGGGPGAPTFTVVAKADRIDRHRKTGAYVIIDYKTGATPTARQVEAGFAPQLPLEAWLADVGAFEGLEAGPVQDLVFWKLSGGDTVQEQKRPIKDIAVAIEQAEQGLRKLVASFSRPETAYLSNPRPTITGYGEFDHLARVKEWRNETGPLKADGETPS